MEFLKYRPYLQEFNYPNIDIINDDQIIDLFGSANRYVLLQWLVKNINSNFVIPADFSDASIKHFADFFYQCGFCTFTQKRLFAEGNKNLSLKDQITCFDRIFNTLQNASEKENVDPKQIVNTTENVQLFMKKDVNLFPTLGMLKTYPCKEINLKCKFYKNEIASLKENIENLDDSNHQNNYNLIKHNYHDIKTKVENFKEEVIKLNEIITNMDSDESMHKVKHKFGFQPGSEKQFTKCGSNISLFLQYFKNLNLVHNLAKNESQAEVIDEDNKMGEILKITLDTSTNVLGLLNDR